jgi:hypothetical protein
MAVGQAVYISPYGYYEVTAVNVDGIHATVQNLCDGAGTYADNIDDGVGVTFANGSKVSPAGVQGPTGATPANVMLKTDNLSGLANLATSRTNLGLGSISTQPANNVAITGGSITGITDLAVADGGTGASASAGARTNLGAAASGLATASGLTVSAVDKILGLDVAGPSAVKELTCTAAGRALIDDATAAAQLVTLGRIKERSGLLGLLTVDLNGAIADQNVPVTFTRAIIRKVVLEAASVNLAATATRFGLYTGSGKTGTAIVTDPFDPAALTAATKWIDVALAAGIATDVVVPDLVNSRLYFYLSVAHGVAATAKLWVFGEDLS